MVVSQSGQSHSSSSPVVNGIAKEYAVRTYSAVPSYPNQR